MATKQDLTVYVSLATAPDDPTPPIDEGDAESNVGDEDDHSV